MSAQLAAYISFTFLLAATPGSTTAVVVRNALAARRRAGYITAVGAAVANALQAVCAGLGLAVILQQWPAAAFALRIGGAAYLAWLGAQSLLRIRRGQLPAVATATSAAPVVSGAAAFRQGLLVNVLNPPITTFYLVIVPSFMPAGAGAATFAGRAAIHIVLAWCCHTAWVVAFDAMRSVIARPVVGRTLETATAIALFVLAIRTALPR